MDLLTATQSERCRLVLVSAQAGSGKTTAIVQWLRQLGWPVGWVSLDRRDNQPKQFFEYLIAALRKVIPEIGKEALELLDLPGGHRLLDPGSFILLFPQASGQPNTSCTWWRQCLDQKIQRLSKPRIILPFVAS